LFSSYFLLLEVLWDGNEFSVGCWLVLLVFVHWNEVVSSGAEHGIRLLVLMVQE